MNTGYPPLPAWERIREPKSLPKWYIRFGETGEVMDDEKNCGRKNSIGAGRPPTLRPLIMGLFKDDNRWLTVNEMALAIGVNRDSIRETIRRYHLEGRLRRRVRPGGKNPAHEYQLAAMDS